MSSEGWIKLHRKTLEWEWFDEPVTVWLFIKCLLLANHEDKRWHGTEIKRGSFITSLKNLSSKKAKVSVRMIRTSLNRLKSTSEVTIETTNRYSLISIVKWDYYQSEDRPTTSRTTSSRSNNRQATDKQPTTNKNDKNDKNEKNREKEKPSRQFLEEVNEEVIVKLREQFPGVEGRIRIERNKAADWLDANGKTYKDYVAFFRNWLRRIDENKKNKKGD